MGRRNKPEEPPSLPYAVRRRPCRNAPTQQQESPGSKRRSSPSTSSNTASRSAANRPYQPTRRAASNTCAALLQIHTTRLKAAQEAKEATAKLKQQQQQPQQPPVTRTTPRQHRPQQPTGSRKSPYQQQSASASSSRKPPPPAKAAPATVSTKATPANKVGGRPAEQPSRQAQHAQPRQQHSHHYMTLRHNQDLQLHLEDEMQITCFPKSPASAAMKGQGGGGRRQQMRNSNSNSNSNTATSRHTDEPAEKPSRRAPRLPRSNLMQPTKPATQTRNKSPTTQHYNNKQSNRRQHLHDQQRKHHHQQSRGRQQALLALSLTGNNNSWPNYSNMQTNKRNHPAGARSSGATPTGMPSSSDGAADQATVQRALQLAGPALPHTQSVSGN